MQIGKLNKRIKIQEQVNSKDEYGEVVDQWKTVKEMWAEVKPITGRSFFSAQQVNSEITHQVIIRYCDSVKVSMRVILNDRTFEILYCMNFNESNEAIQLMCKEMI